MQIGANKVRKVRKNEGRRFDLEPPHLSLSAAAFFFSFRLRSQLAATAATSFFSFSPCPLSSLYPKTRKPLTKTPPPPPPPKQQKQQQKQKQNQVGVGTATSKEVVDAVQKAVIAAKKEMVTVPLTRGATFPHRVDGVFGAARVMLRPASEGTGVIAGGAVRVVLELAGVKNAFGKQLGSGNPLNNARAAVEGLRLQRTVEMVAKERGLTVAQMLQHKPA